MIVLKAFKDFGTVAKACEKDEAKIETDPKVCKQMPK
jgi:hypothetical protein